MRPAFFCRLLTNLEETLCTLTRIFFICFFILTGCMLSGQTDSGAFIPKEKAIQIARRHGCYRRHTTRKTTEVYLDTAKAVWMVSINREGYTKKGHCRRGRERVYEKGKRYYFREKREGSKCRCVHTNGCTKAKWKEIKIDARTGKIIRISKGLEVFPNYE